MSRAHQIARTAHTAGQVRREAQRWCASSLTWRGKEQYRFTDGSSITVTGNRVRIRESSFQGGQENEARN